MRNGVGIEDQKDFALQQVEPEPAEGSRSRIDCPHAIFIRQSCPVNSQLSPRHQLRLSHRGANTSCLANIYISTSFLDFEAPSRQNGMRLPALMLYDIDG